MNYKMALEAILFATGDGVTIEQISEALQIDKNEAIKLVNELKEDYEQNCRGIRLTFVDDLIQLCTAKEYFPIIAKAVKGHKEVKLTQVALETLAIIAYKQPVTKADIEKIRGVKSDYAVNQLIEYGLIEEAGRLQAPGNPLLFETTKDFLRGFGMSSIDELPKPQEQQLQLFSQEAMQELDYFPDENEDELTNSIDLDDFNVSADDVEIEED